MADFSGYATKNDLRCSDGRVIRHDAFIDNDGMTVPLVWNHGHNSPDNVLGHAELENRKDGVYAYCTFNKTKSGKQAKEMVRNGDISQMSIHANRLTQNGSDVVHGNIVEVSLVISGANPGARIDNVAIQHSDGFLEEDETEAVITSGLFFEHADDDGEQEEDADLDDSEPDESEEDYMDEQEFSDYVDSLSDEQVDALATLMGIDDDDADYDDVEHYDEEEGLMHSNVFEPGLDDGAVLSHSQIETIFEDAKAPGMTLKSSFLSHAADYGIKNPELLFPDATNLDKTPQRIERRKEWVSRVLQGATHTPFSRVKTQWSDLTVDDIRAKGYVKASRKKDVVYSVANRVTTPTTIYNRWKIDRDDVLDITTFDVVAWAKENLRTSLDEELARAILIGDGRDVSNQDKVKEENVRPIWTDDELFAHHVTIPHEADQYGVIDAVRRARKNYHGSGSPVLFTTNSFICEMLELRDKNNRYVFETPANIANQLNVSAIVDVELMEGKSRDTKDLIGIIVNMADYTIGADKGGEINFFDDFDIDFNQQKYLLETRVSGALTKYKSALVIEKAQA